MAARRKGKRPLLPDILLALAVLLALQVAVYGVAQILNITAR